MQQQYQLSFRMPLALAPKQQQEDHLKLPEDLALLQTVSSGGYCSQLLLSITATAPMPMQLLLR